MIKSVAFIVYPVADVHRAQEFYEKKLGLHLDCSFGEQWLEYEVGGTTFALTTLYGKSPAGNRGTVAFEVDDLDQLVQQLKVASVTFTHEVFDTPICRMATVADPDGNEVILHERKQTRR